LKRDTYDATISESGGTTCYHSVFTGVNKFDYTHSYTHSWKTPPRKLTPGEKITLNVIAADAGSKGVGDTQFYHSRWGETFVSVALLTSRAITARMKEKGYTTWSSTGARLGDVQATAWTDLYRPKEEVTRDEKSVTITIPGHDNNDMELVIGYNINCPNVSANITLYYKWNGPPVPPPPPYTGGCVSAGTLVTRADGTRVPIEQLHPGDRIVAYDQARHLPATATVERVLVHADGPYPTQLLTLQSGQTLQVTGNHPIYTTQGAWVPVEELTPGAGVYVYNAANGTLQPTTVLAIIRDQGTQGVVYNLKTSLGDYYANDLLVHNKCLAAGAWIDTPAGPCPVERLHIGQLIYGQAQGRRVATPVTHLYAKTTVLPTLPGKRLTPHVTATSNHRVWDGAQFRQAGTWLRPDAAIAGTVYDVQTAAGNYFADGLLMTANE